MSIRFFHRLLWAGAVTITLATSNTLAQSVSHLTVDQRRELTVFGFKGGLGLRIGQRDIKNVLSGAELEHMIATGLNGNGLLCAKIVSVLPLLLKGKYEVICVAYRGGSGQKMYVVDALEGVGFEQ